MEEFLKVMVLKVMICVLAKGWVSITAYTLKNEWHKLMASCNICVKSWHQWRPLLSWVSSVIWQRNCTWVNEYVSDTSNRAVQHDGAASFTRWAGCGPRCTHCLSNDWCWNYADGTAGKNKDNEDLSDNEEDEEGVQERVSVHNCIQLITDSIEDLKQRHIFSVQEIITVHIVQECLSI